MNIIDRLLESEKYGEQDPCDVQKFEALGRGGYLTEKQIAFGEAIIRRTTKTAETEAYAAEKAQAMRAPKAPVEAKAPKGRSARQIKMDREYAEWVAAGRPAK